MPLAPINAVSSIDHQKKTSWDFYFTDNIFFKFRVKSCTLPLPKFEIETRHTWENFYKTMTITTTFDVEIYEDIAFSTYRYFQLWRELVYNSQTRTFISYPSGTFNPIFKTAIFQYYPISTLLEVPPNKIFQLENVKLVGLGDLSNDYEDGSGLIHTVTLAFENIIDI